MLPLPHNSLDARVSGLRTSLAHLAKIVVASHLFRLEYRRGDSRYLHPRQTSINRRVPSASQLSALASAPYWMGEQNISPARGHRTQVCCRRIHSLTAPPPRTARS